MIFSQFLIFVIFLTLGSTRGDIYTSYQKSMVCNSSQPTVTPTSVNEIITVIQNARKQNKTVKAYGHLHSIVDLICTNGIPINMGSYKAVTVNADNTVTAQAGATVDDVVKELDKVGRTLENMPLYRGITIGGSTGCGSHGGSLTHVNTIADQVISMTFVDGLGNLRIIDDEKTLQKTRVHLGLLGVLVEAKLRTVPKYNIRYTIKQVPEIMFRDGSMVNAARNSDVSVFIWSPNLPNGFFALGVNTTSSGTDLNNMIGPQISAYWKISRDIFEDLQKEKNFDVYKLIESEQLSSLTTVNNPFFIKNPKVTGQNVIGVTALMDATGNSWEMIASYCQLTNNGALSQCFWTGAENESIYNLNPSIAIRVDQLPNFFDLVAEVRLTYDLGFALGGLVFRFAPQSSALMALENMGETVHIEFFPVRRNNPYEDPIFNVNGYQALIQLMITRLQGRPHWGKSGPAHHTYNNLINNNMGANLTTFIDLMNDFDPDNIFANDFKVRITTKGSTQVTKSSNVRHCALEDFCICSVANDCANGQFCEPYDTAKVCSDVKNNTNPIQNVVPTVKAILNNIG